LRGPSAGAARVMIGRRIAVLAFAFVAAVGLSVAPARPGAARGTGGDAGPTPPEVRAAAPGLTIVSTAAYDVQPEAHRVHVSLDLQLTNRLRDSKTRRFYFDRAFLSVLPGTENYKLTWSGGGTPRAKVSN